MKTILGLMVLCSAVPSVSQQQDESDFTYWMRQTGAASGALGKLNSKTGPEAVAHAEKLGVIYENMIGYWRQRNAADAVKWSEQGKAAAVALASAANSGEAEAAASALNRLNGTCRPCHDAHREKMADGKYRIK